MTRTSIPEPISRTHLIQALAHGLRFGRTRIHHGDDLMARLAAEKLADYMQEANLLVVQAPALLESDEQCRLDVPEPRREP